MGFRQKLEHELREVVRATLYFGCWIAILITLKQLVLEEYQIEFSGMSKALIGALILAKVVLVLEHVSLGARIRAAPAWVDILLRTLLYSFGVFVVLLLEHGFEGRHEYGSFAASLEALFQHEDLPHILATCIVLFGALLGYNFLSALRAHLGEGGLRQILLLPIPGKATAQR